MFATGYLTAYQNLGAQLHYALPKCGTTIEVGGSTF